MSIEYLRMLSLNPHLMGKLIQNFLEGYSKPADLLLVFYVLPIILYKDSRNKLSNANSRSSLESLFQNRDVYDNNENLRLSSKVNLAGFVDRFDELKNCTKQAIITLTNENKIKLGSKVSLLVTDRYDNYKGNIRTFLKAAYYLGVIFSKTTKEYLDSFLGVKAG